MNRTARALHVEALDALLRGRMAEIAVARDWELLRELLASPKRTRRSSWPRRTPRCSRPGALRSQNIISRVGPT